MWRLAHLPAPQVSVLIGTSREGEKNYPAAKEFLNAVKPPMKPSRSSLTRAATTSPPGGANCPPRSSG